MLALNLSSDQGVRVHEEGLSATSLRTKLREELFCRAVHILRIKTEQIFLRPILEEDSNSFDLIKLMSCRIFIVLLGKLWNTKRKQLI